MSGINVITESEVDRGWRFECTASDDRRVTLTLQWVEYNHWCPVGNQPPSEVACAVLAFLEQAGVDIPDAFDAGRVRHLHADADSAIREALDTTG